MPKQTATPEPRRYQTPRSGYWEPVRVGANRALGELELTGQVEAPVVAEDYTQGEAAAEQVKLFQQRRMDGYHGIAIAPLDDSITDEINSAVDSDIVTVTLDSDLSDSERQLYVGTNNRQAGYTRGRDAGGFDPRNLQGSAPGAIDSIFLKLARAPAIQALITQAARCPCPLGKRWRCFGDPTTPRTARPCTSPVHPRFTHGPT